jgi:signal transduction histidine kinase
VPGRVEADLDWARLFEIGAAESALAAIAAWVAPRGDLELILEFAPDAATSTEDAVEVPGDPPWRIRVARLGGGSAPRETTERAAQALHAWRAGRAALSRSTRRLAARTGELDLLQAVGRAAAEARLPEELFRVAAEALHEHEEPDAVLFAGSWDPGRPRALAYAGRPVAGAALTDLAARAAAVLDDPPPTAPAVDVRRLDEYDEMRSPRPELADGDEAVIVPLVRRGRAVASLAVLPLGRVDGAGRRKLFGVANQLSLHLDRILTVREAERGRFRATLDSMPQAVFLTDRDLRVVQGNRSAEALRESLGLPADDGRLERVGDVELGPLAEGVAAGRVATADVEARTDDERIFDITVSAVGEDRDDPTALVVVLSDVTESRRLQIQVAQSEKMYSLGQMISGIAHELNNPLASIVGFSQLLRARSDADEKLARRLDLLQEQATRCQKIVSNLLAFARGHEPERRPLNLNEVVEAVLTLMVYQLRVDDVRVETDLDRDLPSVPGDGHQLQQVLVNLMTNAQHAIRDSGQGGRVVVRTRRRDDRAVIEIEDDGPGIPEALRPRVFDPFFTTKDVGKGTGLGLSLVYGIVTAHEGTIAIDGDEGQGTTFRVELPCLSPGAARAAAEAADRRSAARRGRVLVVDDEAAITELISDVLGSEGHHVRGASDGREALQRIARERFDVVITDMKMPGMGGERLVDALSRLDPQPRGRLLITTGDTVSGDAERVAERIGAEVLHKPFDIHALIERVDGILGADEDA